MGAAPTIASAIDRAPSQVRACHKGDQRNLITPAGTSSSPAGSNNQIRPSRERHAAEWRMTSDLVDVETTAPGAASTDGIMRLLVFPDLGGPSTRTALSR